MHKPGQGYSPEAQRIKSEKAIKKREMRRRKWQMIELGVFKLKHFDWQHNGQNDK